MAVRPSVPPIIQCAWNDLYQRPIEELRTLLAAVGATDVDPSALTGHIVDRSRGRWRGYAEDAWFRKREMRCEAVLRRWRTCSSG